MDRVYNMSCSCVYHSHHGYQKTCKGAAFVHSNPKTLTDFEAEALRIHQESDATISGVVAASR